MSQSITPRQRALFVVFLLALFPAGNALHSRMDEDTWWHLAVGRYIVDHGAVTETDPFSRISQEQQIPWIAYSWLHEVLVYECFQAGGLPGILVFRHVLDSLTFLSIAWFVLRRSGGSLSSLGVLALVTASLVPMMLERPWHYTIVLTTLTLHATLEWREGTRPWKFWWLIPAFALWANLHIQFVLGFGVLGLGLIVTIIEHWRGQRSGREPKNAGIRDWGMLLGACMLATFLNPYHVRLYGVIWEYATQTGALRVVAELAPPNFRPRYWWNWALLALLLWGSFECVRARLPLFETSLLVVGVIFSLRMQRDIWFGALTAATAITRLRQGPSTDAIRCRSLLAVTVLAVILVRTFWLFGPGKDEETEKSNARHYPAGAVAYLREHRPPGPLYNQFNWGGYLIWTLPEYPVSIDGRTNLYGEKRLQRAFETWNAIDWEEDPDIQAAGVVLVPKKMKGIPLREQIGEATDRWRVVYEDDVSIVYVPIK